MSREEFILSNEEENIPEQEEVNISPETQEQIEVLQKGIDSSKELSDGLGRIAKEKILKGMISSDELKEMYYKKIGEGNLTESDAFAFEGADEGLRAKHFFKKIITLGKSGSKHVLKEEGGFLVDKRELMEEFEGKKINMGSSEAVRRGLDIRGNYKIQYESGKKIIFGEQTEQEAYETAGKIFKEQLKKLETETDGNLIKQREKSEKLGRDIEKFEVDLGPEATESLREEKASLEESNKDEQEKLDSSLEVIREPLKIRQEYLAESINDLTVLLEGSSARDGEYKNEIKELNDKIKRILGSEIIKESPVVKEKIEEWEEQKAQLEANKEAFNEKKKELEFRITALKSSKKEIDATLIRINSIGKTKEELRAEKEIERENKEKEAKKRAETEARKKSKADAGTEVKKRTRKKAESETGEASEDVLDSDAIDDGLGDEQEWDNKPGTYHKDEIASAEKSAKKKKSIKTFPKKLVALASEPVAGLTPEISALETNSEGNEDIKESVSDWLIFLDIQGKAKIIQTAVKNNFIVGEKFNKTALMTLAQARNAYIGYLLETEYKKDLTKKAEAEKVASEKFIEITKDLK